MKSYAHSNVNIEFYLSRRGKPLSAWQKNKRTQNSPHLNFLPLILIIMVGVATSLVQESEKFAANVAIGELR
jgi:hypothetical protein